MAESQYNADSARNPHPFPHPLLLSGTSRREATPPIANDGDPGSWHPVASVSIKLPAKTAPTFITLHS